MATTSSIYSGDGATRDFSIGFDYTSRSFVKCYVGGVLTAAWTFLNATTVRFNVAPIVGTNNIEIRRVTSTTPIVDFVAAATITDTDLDLAIGQMLDVLEENQNNSTTGMTQAGGAWDAVSKRIANVAAPLAGNDATNKTYVDGIAGSATAASASASAAASSANDALTQAGNALTQATAAGVSASAAAASAASIASVYPISGMTANYPIVATGAATAAAVQAQLQKFISTTPLTGASVNITLSGGYDEYMLIIEDFLPATDAAALVARFSVDNAVTFKNTNGDYNWTTDQPVPGGNDGTNATGGANSASLRLVGNLDNAVKSRQLRAVIHMGDGTLLNEVEVRGSFRRSQAGNYNGPVSMSGALTIVATRATHIQLLMDSGNLSAGNALLYGVTR